jgi:hypothetical protein
MNALEAEVQRAAVLPHRLGVVPAAGGDRPAIGAEHRRHLDVVETHRCPIPIENAAAQPASLVGDGDEARAVGTHANGRNAAEVLVRRGEFDAAAE